MRCGRFLVSLDQPIIMGILNITPDSFSDGGQFASVDAVLARAEQMIANGAEMLDIGGESTRPGAAEVSIQEELDRVLPVLEALKSFGVPLSLDTRRTEVMQTALVTGNVDMINDISALEAPGAMQAVAQSHAAVCLMHMQGTPQTMQNDPVYSDVVQEVQDYLLARAAMAEAAGISKDRIVLDPGFGFGKSQRHNLQLLDNLNLLCEQGYPVLAGMSRKRMLGEVTGRPAMERDPATVASTVLAAQKGAAIIRVHNVGASKDALRLLAALTYL
jgi:dihydropteroate synthase